MNRLDPQSERRSCGIVNLGGTCYMNAAIQFLYAMDSLRDYIFKYDGNDQILRVLQKIFKSLRDKRGLSGQEVMALYKEIRMWQNGFYNRSLNVCDGWFYQFWQCEEPLYDLLQYFMNVSGLGCLAKSVSEYNNDASKLRLSAEFCSYINFLESSSLLQDIMSESNGASRCKQFGDYVIIGSSSNGSQVFDCYEVNGAKYEPIACVTQTGAHYYTTIKQLDGRFIRYNDSSEIIVGGFDKSSLLALYKRIAR